MSFHHPSSKLKKQPLSFTRIDECKDKDILKCKSTDRIITNDDNRIVSKLFSRTITVPKILSGLEKSKHRLFVDKQLFSGEQIQVFCQENKQKEHEKHTQYQSPYSPIFYAQKQRTHHYVFGFIRTHQLATNINIPHEIFNTIFNYCYIDNVKDLLKPIPILTMDMEVEIFIERLNLCCTIFDFKTNSNNECVAIQNKKERLSEIMDYLEMNDNIWMNKQILKCIMNMIQKNLFRSLPYININTPDYFYEFQDEQFEDPHF
eukprot:154560_1